MDQAKIAGLVAIPVVLCLGAYILPPLARAWDVDTPIVPWFIEDGRYCRHDDSSACWDFDFPESAAPILPSGDRGATATLRSGVGDADFATEALGIPVEFRVLGPGTIGVKSAASGGKWTRFVKR